MISALQCPCLLALAGIGEGGEKRRGMRIVCIIVRCQVASRNVFDRHVAAAISVVLLLE